MVRLFGHVVNERTFWDTIANLTIIKNKQFEKCLRMYIKVVKKF